jgi:sugar phosphate isomerase/epimerase
MKLSFATLGCPSWTLDQIVANAATLGFDGVELRGVAGEHIGPDESPDARASIRRRFEKAGIGISCIMGYSNFAVEDPEKRGESVTAIGKFITIARDIGCPIVRVFGGRLTEAGRDACAARVVTCLKQLAPQAEKAGVTLAMETHDDWCYGEYLAGVIEAVDSPAVRICWDMCNSYFVEPYEKTFPRIKDYIRHVHFKDAARDAGGKISSTLPGTGQVPMGQALDLLVSAGYDGYLSFEWEKKWEPALEEPEVAFPRFLAHTRALLKQAGARIG